MEPVYRVGRHQPQNVYRDDDYIGVMFNPEDAALVVQVLNEATADESELPVTVFYEAA